MSAPDPSPPSSSLILYQTGDGRTRIQCRFEDENIWLTQAQMAELFQTTPHVNAEPKLHLFGRYENDATSAITRFSFSSELPSLRRLIRPEVSGF